MHSTWKTDYPKITTAFMDYGWFVAPFIMGREFANLLNLSVYIQANPPPDDKAKAKIEEKIYAALLDNVYSHQVRARYVWLAIQTPHVKEYSHLYEAAVFAYYKREYAAAIPLLLISLEGVLLSLLGWKIGQPNKPTFAQLQGMVGSIQPHNFNPDLLAAQVMFRDALDKFVTRWLYPNTNVSDFTLSVLNRHYILHGLEAGNFYRPADAHRLLLAFDLLIDVVSMSNGLHHTFVPNSDAVYSDRNAFYERLRAGNLSVVEAAETEQKLLKGHSNYNAPTNEPFSVFFTAVNK